MPVLLAAAAWSLLAFGGAPSWTHGPLLATVTLLVVIARPWRSRERGPRTLDLALVSLAGALVLQILPLPRQVLDALSPQADRVRQVLLLVPAEGTSASPLSIAPDATGVSLALLLAALCVFWAARRTVASFGPHTLVMGIATLGLVAACVAVVQRAVSPDLVYGIWRPADPDAHPFGPFVNRNHFVTWLLLALPLTIGALVRQARRAVPPSPSAQRPRAWASLAAPAILWLSLAAGMMLLVIVMSFSRSGLVGLTAAAGAALWLARPRARLRPVSALLLLAAIVLPVAWFADFGGVLARIDETTAADPAGRLAIWRDTMPVIHDFWVGGTGAGTFARAMLVYQRADRAVFFNQAHSHYLQLAAEGGLLLLIPAIVAAAALTVTIWRRLAEETRSAYWIRCGAVCGLVALAVQSVWETGLRMPANAVLCAMVAAIAVAGPVSPSARGVAPNEIDA